MVTKQTSACRANNKQVRVYRTPPHTHTHTHREREREKDAQLTQTGIAEQRSLFVITKNINDVTFGFP